VLVALVTSKTEAYKTRQRHFTWFIISITRKYGTLEAPGKFDHAYSHATPKQRPVELSKEWWQQILVWPEVPVEGDEE